MSIIPLLIVRLQNVFICLKNGFGEAKTNKQAAYKKKFNYYYVLNINKESSLFN